MKRTALLEMLSRMIFISVEPLTFAVTQVLYLFKFAGYLYNYHAQ